MRCLRDSNRGRERGNEIEKMNKGEAVEGWERETIPGVEGLLQLVVRRDEMGKTFARALAAGVGAGLIHKGPMPECAPVIASSM